MHGDILALQRVRVEHEQRLVLHDGNLPVPPVVLIFEVREITEENQHLAVADRILVVFLYLLLYRSLLRRYLFLLRLVFIRPLRQPGELVLQCLDLRLYLPRLLRADRVLPLYHLVDPALRVELPVRHRPDVGDAALLRACRVRTQPDVEQFT